MWDSLAPWLAGGGAGGLVLGFARLVYQLHADVIGAERRRADDARARAEAAERRADVREDQIGILLGRPREPS